MRGWLEHIKWKTEKWMQGRYGHDELYIVLLVLGFVFLLLSRISQVFLIFSSIFLLVALFRYYSRNVDKWKKECDAFLGIVAKPQKWAELQKLRWKDRKTHRYFKCGNCGQILRVPVGKGKIVITCPKCHKENIKKYNKGQDLSVANFPQRRSGSPASPKSPPMISPSRPFL